MQSGFSQTRSVLGILLWKEGAAGLELFRGNAGRATSRVRGGIFIRGPGVLKDSIGFVKGEGFPGPGKYRTTL